MSNLIKCLKRLKKDDNKNLIISILAESKGSVPQQPGSAMLSSASRLISGTIGGGYFEHETLRSNAAMKGNSEILSFNLNNEYNPESGPVCGGSVKIIKLKASMIADELIDKAVFLHDQKKDFSLNFLADSASNNILSMNISEETSVKAGTFSIDIKAKNDLIIVGAGHVGKAIYKMSSFLDFNTYLIDPRNDINSEDTEQLRSSFEEFLETYKINDKSYIVLVNKDHSDDYRDLLLCIRSDAAYTGMIGSRRKARLMRSYFLDKGLCTKEEWDRVYTPTGIELGAFEVNEIALSILSEITAVKNKVDAGDIKSMKQ